MSFILADVLSPTPQMPKMAGGVVAAPDAGEGGAFADALKAFRAAAETATGEVGVAIAVSGEASAAIPEVPVRAQVETVIGLEAALVPAAPMDAVDPDAPVAEIPAAPVDILPETAGDAPELPADPNLAIATPVVPVAAEPVLIDTLPDDATLKMPGAAETPEAPPSSSQPQMPLRPGMPDAESAAPETGPLLEGRASAAGAPPPPVLSTGDTVPELPKDVVDALAPRAVTKSDAPPVIPPQTAPAVQTGPVPAALQVVVAEPDVISVQAKAAADADANGDGEAAPVVTTPAIRGGERAATAAVPATSSVPAAQAQLGPQPVLDEPVLAAGPETSAKAADGALAVLTEKKPQTPANSAPVAEPGTPAKAAVTPVTAADPALDVKTPDSREALTDKSAPQEKPAADRPALAADKPAPQTDARAPQAPMPASDKPAPAELAVKAVQQQSQSLPAAAIPQIAGEIASKVKGGATRFEIRLDPPELGRIDVRIDVDKDGRVTSRLMVEKTETLDLLKADQRALERALHDAGFKSDQNSLSFSLKDQRDGQAKFDEQRQLNQPADPAGTEEEPVRHVAESAYRAAMRGPGGLDLRV